MFVAVDGGMSDNPRVARYCAKYTAVLANRHPATPTRPVTVVAGIANPATKSPATSNCQQTSAPATCWR